LAAFPLSPSILGVDLVIYHVKQQLEQGLHAHGFIVPYKFTRKLLQVYEEKDEKPCPQFATHNIKGRQGQQVLLMRGPSCSNVYLFQKVQYSADLKRMQLHGFIIPI